MKFRNIIANFLGRVWSILLLLLLTPFYINNLGFESYGLIGFFATVQSITTILELGFPLALNRAMARYSAKTISAEEISSLFKGFERLFFLAGLLIIILSIPSSYILSNFWFDLIKLSPQRVTWVLICIFMLAAFRFPIGLHLAVLAGLQQQVLMNTLNVVFVTLRLGGSALVIGLLYSDILFFFIAQIFISLIELLVIRHVAWSSDSGLSSKVKVNLDTLKKHTSFAFNVAVITVLGIVLLQMDKIFVSGSVSLEEFGHYSLIGVIGAGLITLGYPVATASFPHFTKLLAEEKFEELNEKYFLYLRLVCLIALPLSVSIAYFAEPLLVFYTQGASLPDDIFTAFVIFILAAFFGSLRPVSYGLLISADQHVKIIKYYLFLLPIYIVSLVILIQRLGIIGASLAFFGMQISSVFVFFIIALKFLKIGNFYINFGKIFILPLIVSIFISSSAGFLLSFLKLDIHVVLKLIAVYIPTVLVIFSMIYSKDEIYNEIKGLLNSDKS